MKTDFIRKLATPAALAALALAFANPSFAQDAMVMSAGGDDMKAISKVDPEFPREALKAGTEKGKVKARMTVDAGGEVSRVEIIDANPRRVFDRAVVRALSQWKFTPGNPGRSLDVEIGFGI